MHTTELDHLNHAVSPLSVDTNPILALYWATGVVDACCSPWQTLAGRHTRGPCLIPFLWRIRAVST